MEPKLGVTCEDVEVTIGLQHLEVGTHGYRGNKAVIQRADGLSRPPTSPIKRGRLLEVTESLNRYEVAPRQQTAQLPGVRLTAPTREYLHDDDVGGVEWPVRFDETTNMVVHLAAGRPQILDPS